MTPLPAMPAPMPRPQRIEMLTPRLMTRFDDAARWARRSAIGMMIAGVLFAAVGLVILFGHPDGTSISFFALAVVLVLPSGYLFSYGRSVDRALDRQPALNVELGLAAARRFWIVLTVCFLLATVGLVWMGLVPTFLSAVRGSKEKATIARMTQLRDALERYIEVHHSYPNVDSTAALMKELQPAFGTELQTADGWGTEMRYEKVCGNSFCWEYTLTSAGHDKTFGDNTDIILRNGDFVSAPQKGN